MSSPENVDRLASYVRHHLVGAAAGIEVFGRGEHLLDQGAQDQVAAIRAEIRGERERLIAIADALGTGPARLPEIAAVVGEKVSRLKPNDALGERTPLTDLIDLELMRDAVAGKIAGYQAMLVVVDQHPQFDRAELTDLLDTAERQYDALTALHADAARAAFGG